MFGRVSANGSLQLELIVTECVVMLSCLFAGIVSHCLDLLQPILLVADSDNSKLVILGLQALQRLFTHETIPDVGRHWTMMTSFTEVVFWRFVQWLIAWLASFVPTNWSIDWLIDWFVWSASPSSWVYFAFYRHHCPLLWVWCGLWWKITWKSSNWFKQSRSYSRPAIFSTANI